MNSFRVVGGIIFFVMGWDMLQARLGNIKHTDDEDRIDAYVEDISITPLAIPMICGPGAITNAIILMEDADSLDKKIILIISVFLVMKFSFYVQMASAVRASVRVAVTI